MTAPTPPAPAAPAPPAVEPQVPAAAVPAPPAPPAAPAKPSLEDSLATLDEATRAYVLAEVTDARTEARGLRERVKAAEPKLAEYDKLVTANQTELERAQTAAAQSAAKTTTLITRTVQAEVKALAADTFADPSDAAAFLDTSKFANDDGEVDTAAITAALTDLLTRKPHLGKTPTNRVPAPNPALGGSGGGAPDLEALIAEAQRKGEWQTVVALQNQKLLTPPQR